MITLGLVLGHSIEMCPNYAYNIVAGKCSSKVDDLDLYILF